MLLLTSQHKSIKIEKCDKCIPETIKFYNSTKFGVDISDQMAKKILREIEMSKMACASFLQYSRSSWNKLMGVIHRSNRVKDF